MFTLNTFLRFLLLYLPSNFITISVSKAKSGIKLSKKDDEYPMTDITDVS